MCVRLRCHGAGGRVECRWLPDRSSSEANGVPKKNLVSAQTAIFSIADGARNGPDDVDADRTVRLAASTSTKEGRRRQERDSIAALATPSAVIPKCL